MEYSKVAMIWIEEDIIVSSSYMKWLNRINNRRTREGSTVITLLHGSYLSFLFVSVSFLFGFGAIPHSTQGLLLTVLRNRSWQAWGAIQDAGNWSWPHPRSAVFKANALQLCYHSSPSYLSFVISALDISGSLKEISDRASASHVWGCIRSLARYLTSLEVRVWRSLCNFFLTAVTLFFIQKRGERESSAGVPFFDLFFN